MLRVTNLRTSGIKTPNFANLFGTAEQAAENWFGSSFRPQRGISLWRKPKKRGIPHSADSVRNDRIVLFPQAVKPCPPQGPFIRWLGSVDILATTMRIRNHKFLEIVVCYEGRRCDGRSRTPAFCSHCSASFPSGASPLPQSFQQAPIHSAAVAGHPLLDALRGLDLSRSRGAARRTSRIASDPGAHQCARFHDAVSFLAALERANHRASRGRDGAPVARRSPKRPTTSPRRRGCDGLGAGSGQHLFVRRLHHHGQKPLPWRHWLKWVVVADLDQQFLLAQTARRGPWNDCANLPAVVKTASRQTRIGLVLADAEFDSERNHTYIRQQLGAQSVIPAKRGKKTWRVHGVRAEMRRAFPQRLYRLRALIESLFSSVKRKLSARAPGRSLRMQIRQAL